MSYYSYLLRIGYFLIFCNALYESFSHKLVDPESFQMPPESDYVPKRTHRCFLQFADEPIVLVTSFNARWFHHMIELNKELEVPWSRTILETVFDYPLIIYHEEDLPDIPLKTACKVDLREEYDWLAYELLNSTSGLNRYYKLSSFFDPCFVARPGYTKIGHCLILKVGAINHAVQSAQNDQVVFWVDTDVSFREPFPLDVKMWLKNHDVTYIPFFLGGRQSLDLSISGGTREILKSDGRWRLETGLFAVTANERTRAFTKKALSLYRGGMYLIAKDCFNKEPYCYHENRVKYHVFMNDIFVWAILIHADLHQDETIFSVGLKHGVFAMRGEKGPENILWGVGSFIPLFPPAPLNQPNDIVTNFHIQKYIFHYFGVHDRGVLSVQTRVMANNYKPEGNVTDLLASGTWRKITDPGSEEGSLVDFLQVPYMG